MGKSRKNSVTHYGHPVEKTVRMDETVKELESVEKAKAQVSSFGLDFRF